MELLEKEELMGHLDREELEDLAGSEESQAKMGLLVQTERLVPLVQEEPPVHPDSPALREREDSLAFEERLDGLARLGLEDLQDNRAQEESLAPEVRLAILDFVVPTVLEDIAGSVVPRVISGLEVTLDPLDSKDDLVREALRVPSAQEVPLVPEVMLALVVLMVLLESLAVPERTVAMLRTAPLVSLEKMEETDRGVCGVLTELRVTWVLRVPLAHPVHAALSVLLESPAARER